MSRTISRAIALGLFFLPLLSLAQTTVTGTVKDAQGAVLPGANVYIKDSYDGATTDTSGVFKFVTYETGAQTLIASFVGYQSFEGAVELNGKEISIDPVLKEEYSAQNTVLITAGGFGANDESKAIVLNPLDIVTTAGAQGDVYQALQFLPGTQRVGEENGLFVRGGAGSETVTIIDEMIVQKPFFSSVPDIPSRARFSPFLFKGTFFSTGGYSARYGQALSSALVLNTTDLPDTSNGGFNLFLGGFGGFGTRKRKNTSLTFSGGYSDVTPIFWINKQAPDWEIPPRSGNGTLIFRHKPNPNGIFKIYSTYNINRFVVKNPDPFDPEAITRTKLESHNLYTNASYRTLLGEEWVLFLGASHSLDTDDLLLNATEAGRSDQRLQGKVWLSRSILKNSKFWTGGEAHAITNEQSFAAFGQQIDDTYAAGFVETEIYLSPKIAARIGGRAEYSSFLGDLNLAPRTSFALKTGKYSSTSLAFGQFFQNPTTDITFNTQNVSYERADHFLANYTWIKKSRTFRGEVYYKNYANLVRFYEDPASPTGTRYDNSGDGYAQGLDLFWRDQKSINNGEYWVSYSYLDTRRLYRDFPIEAQPSFASNHNFSVVYKHFFSKLRSQVGASYALSSGRPYFNPNLPDSEFNSERTPFYHALNLNLSYLTSIQNNFTVVFLSVANALGRNNVFGYRYSPDGQYSLPVNPPQKRTIFAGMFISFQ